MLFVLEIRPESKMDRGFMYTHIDLINDFLRELMLLKNVLLFLLLVALAGVPIQAEEITVAAAADLNYAMKDLAAQFQQKTGNKVALSFGASGNIYSQIQSGAPYDLFFSADAEYPKKTGRCRQDRQGIGADVRARPPGALDSQQLAA